MAEAVAMQSLPMLRMLWRSSMDLAEQTDKAFAAVMPVFRAALMQAAENKRAELRDSAMAALQERTRRALEQGAVSSAMREKVGAQLRQNAGGNVSLRTSCRQITEAIRHNGALREAQRLAGQEARQILEQTRLDYQKRGSSRKTGG